MLDELLEKATCPEQMICDSLGVSTSNIKMVDEVIARKIQQKSPHEFHLLEIPQTGQAKGLFCFVVSLQCLKVFLKLVNSLCKVNPQCRRYFGTERSEKPFFDAAVLDCNGIFPRPNPTQLPNPRWRPNTKMCTSAPKIRLPAANCTLNRIALVT